MTLKELVEHVPLSVRSGADRLDRRVTGGYSGDLLSDVIANSSAGNVWVTMQIHANIVAVAVLKELAAIILVQGREPAEETLRKAREQHVTICVSALPAFETVGKLTSMIGNGR